MNSMFEPITKHRGFEPCPICGKKDKVTIITKSHFCETAVDDGYYLLEIVCDRCDLQLWTHACKGRRYSDHLGFIKRRWNRMWSRAKEDNDDEQNL